MFFDDIVGQETPKRILTNAILRGRIAPAYLFHGAFGVGKAKTAFSFARVLNCDTKNGCNVCPSCRKLNNFSHPDLKILFPVPSSVKPEEIENLVIKNRDAYFKFYFDKKASIPIDRVRSLRKEVMLKTYSGRKRVIIIINCDRMTQEAANAFLKTLEEPPAHVIFIFATTEPHRVIPTILSRCQRFDFRKLSIQEITNRIIYISKAEEIKIDEDALFLISKKADGSIRDAESMLDQLASYSEKTIKKADVVTVLGLCEADVYFELADAFISKESSRCLDIIDRTINNGYDLHEFVIGCIEHMRALQLVKIGADLEELRYNLQKYKTQAQKFDADDLLRVLNIMCRLEVEMKRSTQPRTVVEATFLRISKLESSVRLSEIFDRLDRLESEFTKKKDRITF